MSGKEKRTGSESRKGKKRKSALPSQGKKRKTVKKIKGKWKKCVSQSEKQENKELERGKSAHPSPLLASV
jgi:hypothetical protein